MERDGTTTQLLNILKSTDKDGIEKYSKEHLSGQSSEFAAYMSDIIAKKGMKCKDIFQKADVPQKYGYNLLISDKTPRNRDAVLRILIAIGATLKEAERALKLCRLGPLYPKVKRDAVIIIAINKGITDVDTVNDWLKEHKEKELKEIPD